MIKTNFQNIRFKEIIYTEKGVEIVYIHYLKNRKIFKKLFFSNIKSCKSIFPEAYYYFSILDKLGFPNNKDFKKMINKNKKDNELYLIDGDYTRIIIELNRK